MPALSTLSSHLFHATPQQRLETARRQLFEEGIRPTGLVGEAVIQSWLRCVGARRDPRECVAFEPVTRSRVHSTLSRNRLLLEAAEPDLAELHLALAGTGCRALLVDATGVVMHTSQPTGPSCEKILPTLSRVGVNLAEGVIGTSAPGIAARTGRACTVLGGEHFFETVHLMHCAAAPIREGTGALAGVLDLSIESRPFGFDARSLVVEYATAIENKLLLMRADDQLVLHFHTNRKLLDTPYEALAGVTGDGQVAWLNEVARHHFECPDMDAGTLFGVTLPQLGQFIGRSQPTLLRLPSGIAVWVQAALHARDGIAPALMVACGMPSAQAEAPPPSPPPMAAPKPSANLDAINRDHIDRTLAACGGNVSSAARKLGVSRGLVYRHLRGPR